MEFSLPDIYNQIYFALLFRDSKISLLNGVLSKETYAHDNTKRMISLKICFLGWLYEVIGGLFTLLTPKIKSMGASNVYLPDAILMFVIIPFVHLMNDEDTKIIIQNENWHQGVLYTLGVRKKNTNFN